MSETQSQDYYLNDIPREEAWERFCRALTDAGLFQQLDSETLPLEQALGRTSASPIWARRSSPHYHASAMDGYALRSADTAGVSDRNPKELHVGQDCVYIDTGELLPDPFDAVLPIEVVEQLADRGTIRIYQAVPPWSHVRPMGEDIVATELILPAGQTLRAIDLAAIAAGGHAQVEVIRKPKVAVIPTGNELVSLQVDPKPGEIPEFNSLMLAGQVEEWGALATRWPIVPDDLDDLCDAIRRTAANHDLILVNAGSSAGSEDFTASAVKKMGTLLVHGVAVRPGHPVIMGFLDINPAEEQSNTRLRVPVIGVPGYPVSAALTADIFIKPLLQVWLGLTPSMGTRVEARLTRKIRSTAGDEEHIRVTLAKVDGDWVTAPLSRGAGVISSLVRADGILVLPSGSQGAVSGERVHVRLLRSSDQLERTILILGSHDLSLDLLGQFLSQRGRRLSSNNIGSVAGLVALSRGEAHIAGSHLLDPVSGEYNLPYVHQYLPERAITLITLVRRQQGLIVAQGNPYDITGLNDLARKEIRFVNRQKGSGTRLLLDHYLEKNGLSPEEITGYHQEEYTHLMLASVIASGKATCGLGIRAAATALNLDFIPLDSERFDLIIPTDRLDLDLFQPLLDVLADPNFQRAVESLDGYDASEMGQIRSIDPS
jgi:putative molybdopterin biosynthesis protein